MRQVRHAVILALLIASGAALALDASSITDLLKKQNMAEPTTASEKPSPIAGANATTPSTSSLATSTPSGCQIDTLFLQAWKAKVAAQSVAAAASAASATAAAQAASTSAGKAIKRDPRKTAQVDHRNAATTAPAPPPELLFKAEDVDLQFLGNENILKTRTTFVLSMKLGSDIAKCIGDSSGPTLFVDHLAFRWLTPIARYIEDDLVRVTYRIDPIATPQQAWNEILLRSWTDNNEREVTIGIGGSGAEVVVASKKVKLSLGFGRPLFGWIALALSGIILAAFALGGTGLQDRRTGPKSYSLSRLVLACWVLTTSATIVLMLFHTGTLPSVADGGLAIMVGASGIGMGLSSLIDTLRNATNPQIAEPAGMLAKSASVVKDFFKDAGGLALHRVQAGLLNALVLCVVWWDLIHYGTVALIDKSWATLVGASTITYLMGKSGEKNC